MILYWCTASAVLLFGSGYRLRISPFRISRTGNILATYTPKNAAVFLDNVLVGTSSPARIRSVFPGSHTIRITHPGYLDYERAIRVEQKETAFLTTLFLIRDAAPELLSQDSLFKELTTSTTFTPSIIDTTGSLIVLKHENKKEIEFRTTDAPNITAFILQGESIVTHTFNSNTYFLVYSPFELWVVDSKNKSARIISRVSKPILDVIALPESPLAFVLFQDELIAYELTDVSGIPQTIIHSATIKKIAPSTDGTAIEYLVDGNGVLRTYRRAIK